MSPGPYLFIPHDLRHPIFYGMVNNLSEVRFFKSNGRNIGLGEVDHLRIKISIAKNYGKFIPLVPMLPLDELVNRRRRLSRADCNEIDHRVGAVSAAAAPPVTESRNGHSPRSPAAVPATTATCHSAAPGAANPVVASPLRSEPVIGVNGFDGLDVHCPAESSRAIADHAFDL